MNKMSDDLIKANQSLSKSLKFGKKKSLKEKIEESDARYQTLISSIDLNKINHRIAVILDDSGSTSGECFNNEVEAFRVILSQSNCVETAYSLIKLNSASQSLTVDYNLLLKIAPNYGGGGTPIHRALQQALEQSITRIILVSDGEPDNTTACYEEAQKAKSKSIKIDTIFVQSVFSGIGIEEAKHVLKEISRITDGIFMSFDKSGNFTKAAAYLTPGNRFLLEDKKIRLMLGSGE